MIQYLHWEAFNVIQFAHRSWPKLTGDVLEIRSLSFSHTHCLQLITCEASGLASHHSPLFKTSTMSSTSTLNTNRQYIAKLANLYASHRPLIQTSLKISLIVYALVVTWRGYVARPKRAIVKGTGKEKASDSSQAQKKPPRVAVSEFSLLPLCRSFGHSQ